MKPIKTIFVISKGKPSTASVYAWFKKYGFKNYTTVVSSTDDSDEYCTNYGGRVITAPKQIDNCCKKKEWLLKQFTKNGEWAFIVCDNVVDVTGVKNEKDLSRKGFECQISPQEMLAVVNKDIAKAEAIAAVLGGYASNANFFFRKKKYRTVGFVWGKMFYIKNCDMEWDNTQVHKDDYVITAKALEFTGRVLINNYFFSKAKRFEKVGGEGSYDKRSAGFVQATKYLVTKFVGMFRIVNRSGLVKDSEVRMCFTSDKQVAAWRYNRLRSVKSKGYTRS